MQSHQEQRGHQERQVAAVKSHRAQRHDGDLGELHQAHQKRFFELVGELPRGGREQEERQDENRLGQIRKGVGVEPAHARRVERDQYDQGVLEDVVVEGAEELGEEKREEAPLPEQLVLVVPAHFTSSPPIDRLRSRSRRPPVARPRGSI